MKERGTAAKRREHVIGLDPFTVPAAIHTGAKVHVRGRVAAGTVVDHHGRRLLMDPQLWLRPVARAEPTELVPRELPRVHRSADPLTPVLVAAS
jgi:hypothetical protein